MQIRVVVECINCDDTGTDVGITDFFTAGVPICSYCAEDMIPVRSELRQMVLDAERAPTRAVQSVSAVYEYEIQTLCEGKWETQNTEVTARDAIRSLKDYRENQPQYAHAIRKVRA